MLSSGRSRLLHCGSQHKDVNRVQYPDSEEYEDLAAVSTHARDTAVFAAMACARIVAYGSKR